MAYGACADRDKVFGEVFGSAGRLGEDQIGSNCQVRRKTMMFITGFQRT
jgi:hypothetical protein